MIFRNKFFSWVIRAHFLECRCFFIKPCYYFLIKNRFYIMLSKRSSHTAKLIAKKWRNTCMIETQNIILKIYVINFPLCTEYAVVTYWIKNWINSSGTRSTFCFILKLKTTLFYLRSLVFVRFTTCCHSLWLIVICCHSLSFVLTRCRSLLLVVLLFGTTYHSLHQPLSFAVTRCTTRRHSLSLDVPLVCLFIYDPCFI